ncbi:MULTISPECIES: hypothetical protein [Catenuloplanes]|uniref:Uncharacterized protein n=1 Tax=Catenuloplanes niger TaxID=587534 RepID=A0AAE3ZPQ4_9ACTN|nr:hypothetical protein [Catenuloplanes niger]MDR7322626.1 hypothetical protein [Catenuloplanes niger]
MVDEKPPVANSRCVQLAAISILRRCFIITTEPIVEQHPTEGMDSSATDEPLTAMLVDQAPE